ncbi:MAG: type II toxin-antitoxin system VapC family toxin [bacterium]|nr:type II toxin-antitoxin system VapC family toxin [bacterium]
MIAVDTNVLVRILIDDPDEQAQTDAARALAKTARQVYVPQIVQVECVWVLESAYKLDKTTIVRLLTHLQFNSAFVLQGPDTFHVALEVFRENAVDFSDCLILEESRQFGAPVYTFDKRLGKQTEATLLQVKK